MNITLTRTLRFTTPCAMLVAVFAAGTLHAEYNVIDTPAIISMDGPTSFTASGSSVTNVYVSKITGTGPAIIEGGGTVAFANPDNDYTGGTTVNDAVFRLDADGCAGSGAITAAVATAHIFLNCTTVPNDLRIIGTWWYTSAMKPGAYPAEGQNRLLPLCSEVTIEGNITSKNGGMLYDFTNPESVSPAPVVTYKKGIAIDRDAGTYLHLCPRGRMIFEGAYIVADYKNNTQFGYQSSAQGTLEFRASSNKLYRAALYNADLDLKEVDAFPETMFYYGNGSSGHCKTYLNGNDQTILGYCWASSLTTGENATGQCLTSDAPATVTIKGCEMERVTGSLVNRLALFGNITLVMDVDSALTEAGFYQDFSVRESTTAGDLIISNGDFRVSGTASFPNVPNIYVGAGGSFTNASTKANAFAGCQSLTILGTMACTGNAAPFTDNAIAMTLGARANFSLPVGATMTVKSLKVGDVEKTDGAYGDGGTPLDQIAQGTVIVRSGHFYVDCATGSDLNDGAEGRPFKTIAAATAVAVSGDVIHVAPGTYGDAEGSQTVGTTGRSRVVLPEGVTLEATGGATNTLIVGAAATGDQIDNATYGTGTNAVRCVYAYSGATVRGFTLTGGRTVGVGRAEESGRGSAFYYSATPCAATVEDCIVSNNVGCFGTINKSIVRNCRVIGNTTTSSLGYAGPGGASCSWYGSIIDSNRGKATVYDAFDMVGCTVGTNNRDADGVSVPQVYYGWDNERAIVNCAILAGRYAMSSGGKLYCTNSLVMSDMIGSVLKREQSYKTIFTNSAAAQLDAEYRPILGSFVGIDRGEEAYSPDALVATDILGTPRILNGAIDIGAVEYDWRPTFSASIGRRFKIADVSPSVTTNATGGLRVQEGLVAGTATSAGPYEIFFDVTGGSLAVYVGGVLVGESSGAGEQSIRFIVANATDKIRFVYTPEAGSTAVLKKFSGARGFSISLR